MPSPWSTTRLLAAATAAVGLACAGGGTDASAPPIAAPTLRAGAPQPDGPLPEGAVARLGSSLLTGSDALTGVAVTRGGLLLTAGFDGDVRAWDPASGLPVGHWRSSSAHREAHGGDAPGMGDVFAAGGVVVATGYYDFVRYDAATGAERHAPVRLPVQIRRWSFSADGRDGAAVGYDGELFRIRDTAVAPTYLEADGELEGVALAPDGALLAWTGREVRAGGDAWPVGGVQAAAFSLDGATVALSTLHDGLTVRSWPAGEERWKGVIGCPEGGASACWSEALAFSPDGAWLAALAGRRVAVWDATQGREVAAREVDVHGLAGAGTVAFSTDGETLFVAADASEPLRWRWREDRALPGALFRHDATVTAVAWLGARLISAASSDEPLFRLWSADGAGLHATSPTPPASARALFVGDGGATVYARGAQILGLDPADGAVRFAWPPWNGVDALDDVVAAAPDSEGAVVLQRSGALGVVGAGGTYRPVGRLGEGPGEGLVAVSPGGGELAVWRDGQLAVRGWPDLGVRRQTRTEGWPDPASGLLAWSGEDLIFGFYGGIWRWSPGAAPVEVLVPETPRIPLGLDGDRLALATYGDVELWSVGERRLVRTLRGHEGHVGTGSFSPDGARLATGADDGTVLIWKVDP